MFDVSKNADFYREGDEKTAGDILFVFLDHKDKHVMVMDMVFLAQAFL